MVGAMESQDLPAHVTIGTEKAFQNNYAFPYKKENIGSDTIYVCNKGSEWARPGEVLFLQCENGTWTAFDGAVVGATVELRQPVFRCCGKNITRPGWYAWETNEAANWNNEGLPEVWQGELWAETRVPG